MSQEIENAIQETINEGFDFNLKVYFSDGWVNCKNLILPNWGFMTLAIIISVLVGIIPIVGIFALILYILPAFSIGVFYSIHNKLNGKYSFGNFFKGFSNINVASYFWMIIGISMVLSLPTILYSIEIGLYDPIISLYKTIISRGFEQNDILVLVQDLEKSKEKQDIIYWTLYAITVSASTVFSMSQFLGYPILVSSNKIGAIKAMTYSFKLCIKKTGWLIMLYVILLIINYAGALLFTFGLIITIPFSAGIVYSIFKTEVLSKIDGSETPLSKIDDLLDS